MNCRTCGRFYTNGGGHCAGCHQSFNSDTAFDKHRFGFVCLTADQMRERGMSLNRKGLWVTEPWQGRRGTR